VILSKPEVFIFSLNAKASASVIGPKVSIFFFLSYISSINAFAFVLLSAAFNKSLSNYTFFSGESKRS